MRNLILIMLVVFMVGCATTNTNSIIKTTDYLELGSLDPTTIESNALQYGQLVKAYISSLESKEPSGETLTSDETLFVEAYSLGLFNLIDAAKKGCLRKIVESRQQAIFLVQIAFFKGLVIMIADVKGNQPDVNEKSVALIMESYSPETLIYKGLDETVKCI